MNIQLTMNVPNDEGIELKLYLAAARIKLEKLINQLDGKSYKVYCTAITKEMLDNNHAAIKLEKLLQFLFKEDYINVWTQTDETDVHTINSQLREICEIMVVLCDGTFKYGVETEAFKPKKVILL